MNSRRDHRSTRAALFDGIEEGGIRASSYSSHEIDEQDNDRAVDGLQDRVNILKREISMKRQISLDWMSSKKINEDLSCDV